MGNTFVLFIVAIITAAVISIGQALYWAYMARQEREQEELLRRLTGGSAEEMQASLLRQQENDATAAALGSLGAKVNLLIIASVSATEKFTDIWDTLLANLFWRLAKLRTSDVLEDLLTAFWPLYGTFDSFRPFCICTSDLLPPFSGVCYPCASSMKLLDLILYFISKFTGCSRTLPPVLFYFGVR